ncbi:YybH family protein [Pseudochryseolinea flava]|uniref:DUF4440 domain-containing protein n=1 Tax=Pseudochryseolinea flava TaxID=2059302 RepID=A0A364XYF8_9BACT|nr:hypothetical protein [Pseudochryseolinea flava]RAV99351.1 hypothetical protein DQQ10_19175 [Pseudochryseolinea flava]
MKTTAIRSMHNASRWLLFFMSTTLATLANAQSQQEITDQVWKPFIASFNSFDTDGFMKLHSRDVIRSSRDAKRILDWKQYDEEQRQGDLRSKKENRRRTLELRFTERLSNHNQAIDIGIYRTTSFNSKGESRAFYGKFHVVLRKENGVWKILVDTDSSENNTIGETDFNSAALME